MIYGPSPTRTDPLPPRGGPAAWGVQGESPSQVSATVTGITPSGVAVRPRLDAQGSSIQHARAAVWHGGRWVTVLGYVATAYAATAYGTATAGVDKWQELYGA
jgi:hypothetical protein